MLENDSADQNQPFVFKSTIGTFLQSVAYFFMTISLGVAFVAPQKNDLLIIFLASALLIHTILAANSRLLASIFAFVTIGMVMFEFFVFFYSMFTTEVFDGMTMEFPISLFCVLCIFTFVTTTQIFCSAALLKLSLSPVSKKKPRSHVEKESDKSTVTQCTHTPPTCSSFSSYETV
ncbi:hypothetical protein L3Y34_016455 [Caenorhabditis briggsae]|uniref:Transmembrane protein n=1 Tax=Caenorhabditis briggsae TaxID=6238 RepID=A0AAE9J0C2_CAEBR|nr:hypothetical protein L3Y34_016455 [Caenorhabditis briggsae]